MLILGIDPGIAITGYGLIEAENKRKFSCITYGCITTKPDFHSEIRLKKLYKELNLLIKKYKPKKLSIEKIYFFKNLKTFVPVSQAKGVILLAAAYNKIPVSEFTPLEVKMAVTGYGKADKKQVQKAVRVILDLKETPSPDDAADALAIAICKGLDNF